MDSPTLLEGILLRDRIVVTSILAAVIAACWLYLLAGAGTGMYPHEMAVLVPTHNGLGSCAAGEASMAGHEAMSMVGGIHSSTTEVLTSSVMLTFDRALLMFSMWWLMMIAMMLPGAAPVVLLHAAVTRQRSVPADAAGRISTSSGFASTTTAFVAGYLVTWGAFSLVAVAAQWALERVELLSGMMTSTSKLLSSALLLAAGIWQLNPLTTRCLRHCRSPIGFLAAHWRPGVGGAFGMGLAHGVFCVGCCWFLMALLFYGGIMNLIWIVAIALFVLVEKVMPAGAALGRAAGVLLIAWGVGLGYTAL